MFPIFFDQLFGYRVPGLPQLCVSWPVCLRKPFKHAILKFWTDAVLINDPDPNRSASRLAYQSYRRPSGENLTALEIKFAMI